MIKDDSQPVARGQDAAVAIDDDTSGKFIIAWRTMRVPMTEPACNTNMEANDILVNQFAADGSCIAQGLGHISPRGCAGYPEQFAPSVCLTDGKVRVAWAGSRLAAGFEESGGPGPDIYVSDFNFGQTPALGTDISPQQTRNYFPSVGRAASASAVGWTGDYNNQGYPYGLIHTPPSPTPEQLRSCTGGTYGTCNWRPGQWMPNLAMRSDGYHVIVWADAEPPCSAFQDPPFDVKLLLINPSGQPIGSTIGDCSTPGTEVLVNDPAHEPTDSPQLSPAIDFDDAGNIIVAWYGMPRTDCTGNCADPQVFARRFHWDGNTSNAPTAVGDEFVVNTDPVVRPGYSPNVARRANPGVALSKANDGQWIVVWNASPNADGYQYEVRGRYFYGSTPLSPEFRVHQETGLVNGHDTHRIVGASAQHTVAFGGDHSVVLAWTRVEYASPDKSDVYFTRLPPGYWESFLDCCKGDMNYNGVVNGGDIQLFNQVITNYPGDPNHTFAENFCRADINSDGLVDMLDVPPFVALLLQGATCTSSARSLPDCNQNEIPDANDIAEGTSQDCNQNFIPDECDIADETSSDVNANGVPDECEPDCNMNDLPDAWDITQLTSADVNANGVPDECEPDCNQNGVPDSMDIAEETSADCNRDGMPDECEPDCNTNGKPDDCDVDPSDPDGNGQTSPDCNQNQYPDECDLTLGPPVGSLDCNENGIPDECDIASGFSHDANTNGVPDECEGGSFSGNGPMQMGGEGADNGGCAPIPEDFDAAWAELYDWCAAQCWGPDCALSGSEQYQAYVNKLCELGLIELTE